jgi:hypothetical protein
VGPVGGDDRRTLLVALAKHLEEQFRPTLSTGRYPSSSMAMSVGAT